MKNQLKVVGGYDLYNDLFSKQEDDDAEDRSNEPVSLKDALSSLRVNIEQAVSHMESDWHPEWEKAQQFWDGESNVKLQAGRSQAKHTAVRDHARAVKPSCMRILMGSARIVEFKPYNEFIRVDQDLANTQSTYVNQKFWQSGGYRLLIDGFQDAILKNGGVMAVVERELTELKYFDAYDIDLDNLDQIEDMEDIIVISTDDDDWSNSPVTGESAVLAQKETKVKVGTESIPLYEFFVSDEATDVDNPVVIGHRTNITISDATAMGLDVKSGEYDAVDVELRASAEESEKRRRYSKKGEDTETSNDPTQNKFLLTTAYGRFDLDGTGIAQLYRFYLGGSAYSYIDHERVDENPYAIGTVDPVPQSLMGVGFYDLLKEDQNTGTSILRATLDNAHAANNRRLAVNDSIANMADVLSPKIGAPIRVRGPNAVTEVGTAPSTGAMLPILGFLTQRSENKVGVTNAAAGLDPDALQSTDKEAARHTAMLGQGQAELIVRNFIETGLKPLMTKLLNACLRHEKSDQTLPDERGNLTNVDISQFQSDLELQPCVGMGTADDMMRKAGLEMIATKQEEVIGKMGMSNPIAGLPQLYNTYTDLASLYGIKNIGRYFNEVTPEMAQAIDKQNAEAEAARQPEPPSRAIVHAEQIKGKALIERTAMEIAAKKELEARKGKADVGLAIMQDDLKRDELTQKLSIEAAKLSASAVDENAVREEQKENDMIDFMDFLDEIIEPVDQPAQPQMQPPAQ